MHHSLFWALSSWPNNKYFERWAESSWSCSFWSTSPSFDPTSKVFCTRGISVFLSYVSEWTIRAVTRARHSIGTASEELHLKSTIQKDHRWLMALWRNPVISLGYLVFSGGQIWRTSDCFLPEVLSILTEGHREEASRHVCGYMRTGLWHLPSMYWRCYSLFSWGLFLSL